MDLDVEHPHRKKLPGFRIAMYLLTAVAAWGAWTYSLLILEQAEFTVVNATVMNIRSGMRTEEARRILQGLPPLASGGNPARFLTVAPMGYVEERDLPAQINPGAWYYRSADETLYYLPKRHNHLHFLSVTNGTVLGWKVDLTPDSTKALTLQSVIPYRWFCRPERRT